MKPLTDARIAEIAEQHGLCEMVDGEPLWFDADVTRFTRAIEHELKQSNDDTLDAAAILVHAYAKGGDSVDWEDVNEAHARACAELGPIRVKEIEEMYAEDEDDDEPAHPNTGPIPMSPEQREEAGDLS